MNKADGEHARKTDQRDKVVIGGIKWKQLKVMPRDLTFDKETFQNNLSKPDALLLKQMIQEEKDIRKAFLESKSKRQNELDELVANRMAYEKKVASSGAGNAGFDSSDELDQTDKHTSYDAKSSSNDGKSRSYVGSPSPKESDGLIYRS